LALVDPSRLGRSAGYLSFEEMRSIDAALSIVLDV
jgi:mRNA interferase MazF